jgi:hypothetical protein
MATIFNFKPVDQPVRSAERQPADRTCEIILFPGVRYERWADVPPPSLEKAEPQKALPTRKPRAKKRALEMAD